MPPLWECRPYCRVALAETERPLPTPQTPPRPSRVRKSELSRGLCSGPHAAEGTGTGPGCSPELAPGPCGGLSPGRQGPDLLLRSPDPSFCPSLQRATQVGPSPRGSLVMTSRPGAGRGASLFHGRSLKRPLLLVENQEVPAPL